MDLHKGTIKALSEGEGPGVGSTFVIELPMYTPEEIVSPEHVAAPTGDTDTSSIVRSVATPPPGPVVPLKSLGALSTAVVQGGEAPRSHDEYIPSRGDQGIANGQGDGHRNEAEGEGRNGFFDIDNNYFDNPQLRPPNDSLLNSLWDLQCTVDGRGNVDGNNDGNVPHRISHWENAALSSEHIRNPDELTPSAQTAAAGTSYIRLFGLGATNYKLDRDPPFTCGFVRLIVRRISRSVFTI